MIVSASVSAVEAAGWYLARPAIGERDPRDSKYCLHSLSCFATLEISYTDRLL